MDPKVLIKLKQHVKVAEAALAQLSAACNADDDAKIKEAMKVYRLAEKKFNALLPK